MSLQLLLMFVHVMDEWLNDDTKTLLLVQSIGCYRRQLIAHFHNKQTRRLIRWQATKSFDLTPVRWDSVSVSLLAQYRTEATYNSMDNEGTLKLTHHNLPAMNRNVDMIDVWGRPLYDQPLIVIDLWVVVICERGDGSGSLLTTRVIEVFISVVLGSYNF